MKIKNKKETFKQKCYHYESEFSDIRNKIRIFWAYGKLALALCFCKNEFNKLLNIDVEALSCMSDDRRYNTIVSKVRSHIGGHGSSKYTVRKFFRDMYQKEKPQEEISSE